jgi:hypothetical protein
MCGGGQGEARRAREDAKRTEDARQARIGSNVADINSAFDGREPQYVKLGQALRERLNEGIDLQRRDAARQSKFALARGGLVGGSAANDANAVLQREGREATLAGERQAQQGVAKLRAADEDARSRMISLAQSGNDIGNASRQTASALQANIMGAQSGAEVSQLGELFGNTAKTYRTQQDAAARRRGLNDAKVYGAAFQRG